MVNECLNIHLTTLISKCHRFEIDSGLFQSILRKRFTMSLVDFRYLNITTITAVVRLIGQINIIECFPLLKVSRVVLPDSVKNKKKIVIPYYGIPGEILSCSTMSGGQNVTRGIVKSKSFPNAITMDVAVEGKNISVKVNEAQVHMTGAKSKEMIRETVNVIIDKVYEAQRMIDYIRERPEETYSVIEWIKENCRGEIEYVEEGTPNIVKKEDILPLSDKIIQELSEEYEEQVLQEKEAMMQERIETVIVIDGLTENINNFEPPSFELSEVYPTLVGYINNGFTVTNNPGEGMVINENPPIRVEKVDTIVLPEVFVQQGYHRTYDTRPTDCYPEGINGKIANFLLDQAFDFYRYDCYCFHLEWITTLDRLYCGDVSISQIPTSMVNYNYDLGFPVKKGKVSKYINRDFGFVPAYENTHDHSDKILLPCTIPPHLEDQIRLKNAPKHTFTLHKSGSVTQSSPCEELAEIAYYLFHHAINIIKDKVIKDTTYRIKVNPPTLESILAKNRKHGIDWVKSGVLRKMSLCDINIVE